MAKRPKCLAIAGTDLEGVSQNLELINGHFTTISGHFFANYMKIFYKTEVPMVILRCLTCLNLNWIKRYDIKHKFFCFLFLKLLDFLTCK